MRLGVLRFGLLALVAVLVASCAARKPVVVEALRQVESRNPVVLVPGITGSQLRDPNDGEIIWGNTRSFLKPKDGGYNIALPLADDRDVRLDAFALIREVRLGPIRVDVYGSLLDALEANGYRPGDLSHPGPEETLFSMPYDWRFGAVRAAREMAGRLEGLRRARGDDVLHVDFICQSNAARIVRWFLLYGDATLEQVEAGTATGPARIVVDKVIFVATAHGGAIRTFRVFQDGRRYVLFGRRLSPEAIFTLPSMYETLPAYLEAAFVDADDRILDVDLWDAESWERYGWGIYQPATMQRALASGRDDLFGDAERRREFLASALDRARRVHHALIGNDRAVAPTRYYSIQNAYRATAERLQLVQKKGRWRTRFRIKGDPKARYSPSTTQSPGDGHATITSQEWLSPREREALHRDPVYVDAPHRELIAKPATQRWILEFLAE